MKTYVDDGSGKLHDKTPDLSDYDGMMVEKQVERICKNCKYWDDRDRANDWNICHSVDMAEDIIITAGDTVITIYEPRSTFGCVHWRKKE
jgi:isocitrate lyase